MKVEKISFAETQRFSRIFLDYVSQKEELKQFYGYYPYKENFRKQIDLKSKFSKNNRIILEKVLLSQYSGVKTSANVQHNIRSLTNENTFTVTTGHQLNIFTGPLYFIFKIITAINACKELQLEYPEYDFVPVYWMASEDHDFAEINNLFLFGKQYVWDTNQRGSVGRFMPNSLSKLLDALPEKMPIFETAYLDHSNLSDSVRYYVNELFQEQGLVVIDGDNTELKKLFIPYMLDDINEYSAHRFIQETSTRLESYGYEAQVHPREINFFYLDSIIRERFVEENGVFRVLNTDKTYTKEELTRLIKEEPFKLSPNVIMRPLYQEVILPNIGYVGGPGEIAYWLQIKSLFQHYSIPYPIILPRNSGMVIDKNIEQKIQKLGIHILDIFQDISILKKEFVKKNSKNSLSLGEEKYIMNTIIHSLKTKATDIDKSLEGFIMKQQAKWEEDLENIEKKIQKSEQQNQETNLKQIEYVKEKLFPQNILQERRDSFLNFSINNSNFVQQLLISFQPFDFQFYILFIHS